MAWRPCGESCSFSEELQAGSSSESMGSGHQSEMATSSWDGLCSGSSRPWSCCRPSRLLRKQHAGGGGKQAAAKDLTCPQLLHLAPGHEPTGWLLAPSLNTVSVEELGCLPGWGSIGRGPHPPSHIPSGLGGREQRTSYIFILKAHFCGEGSRRPRPRALHLQAPSAAYALHPCPASGTLIEGEDSLGAPTAHLHTVPPQPREDVTGEGGCLLQRLPQLAAGLLPPQKLQPREGQGELGGGASSCLVNSRPMPGAAGMDSIRSSTALWVPPAPASCFLSRQALPGAT